VSGNFSITQSSSIGRNIDGLLNLSCFEWSGDVQVMSFKFILRPRPFFMPSTSGLSQLWQTRRILEHLWIPRFGLGLGSAVMSLGNSQHSNVIVLLWLLSLILSRTLIATPSRLHLWRPRCV